MLCEWHVGVSGIAIQPGEGSLVMNLHCKHVSVRDVIRCVCSSPCMLKATSAPAWSSHRCKARELRSHTAEAGARRPWLSCLADRLRN